MRGEPHAARRAASSRASGADVPSISLLLDFVDFLAQRDRDSDRQLAHAAAAASEPAFAKVWNNPEDDVYDRV